MIAVTDLGYREVDQLARDRILDLLYRAGVEAPDPRPCQQCGDQIAPNPRLMRCHCGAPAPRPCQFCGSFFTPKRANGRFCCHGHEEEHKEHKKTGKLPAAFYRGDEPSRTRRCNCWNRASVTDELGRRCLICGKPTGARLRPERPGRGGVPAAAGDAVVLSLPNRSSRASTTSGAFERRSHTTTKGGGRVAA